MLIYANFSYIFIPNLVDIPWSVHKLGRTNMVSNINFIDMSTVPLVFGFGAQVAWTYVHIEYMHSEWNP